MPRLEVITADPDGPVAKGLQADFDHVTESIRRRAYNLFERRGRKDGADLDDWTRAEQELLFPVELEARREVNQHTLHIPVAGFSASDLKVYTIGDQLMLRGNMSEKPAVDTASSEQNRNLFYRYQLPAGARTGEVTADYEKGALLITIPIDTQATEVKAP